MATENDKVNTGALATLVAVGTASMLGISLAVNALVRHEVGSVGADRDETGAYAYRALKKEQLDKLDAPATWAAREKGEVAIPIERAMNLVLSDLKRSPWNATPPPPFDAGTDAATEIADAGAAPEADAGAAPEPPGSAPLSPTPPSSAPSAPTPPPAGSAPPAPRPTAAVPPAPPTPPPTQPPATP